MDQMLLRKRTQYIVLQLEMHWKGRDAAPFVFRQRVRIIVLLRTVKTSVYKGFALWLKLYELFIATNTNYLIEA